MGLSSISRFVKACLEKCGNFSDCYKNISRRHPVLVSSIFPVALAALTPLVVYGMNSGGVPFYIGVLPYMMVLVAKFFVDYKNSRHFEAVSNRNLTLKFSAQRVDELIQGKLEDMAEVIRKSKGSSEVLRRARGRLDFNNSAKRINKALAETIIHYLQLHGAGQEVVLICNILRPNDAGWFELFVSHRTSGARIPNFNTGLNLSMNDCLASRVWRNEIDAISSVPNTEEAERSGRFYFAHPEQRNRLRSICCYRITDIATGAPYAIWAIDSNTEGVFPESGSQEIRELEKIFDTFWLRLALEKIYDDVLAQSGDIIQRAMLTEGGDSEKM